MYICYGTSHYRGDKAAREVKEEEARKKLLELLDRLNYNPRIVNGDIVIDGQKMGEGKNEKRP